MLTDLVTRPAKRESKEQGHNQHSVTATFWNHCDSTFVWRCRNADLYKVGDISLASFSFGATRSDPIFC